ncbi:penicillin acylase family protein, partial [Klebsiella pneumoniae]|nr:penicillin acylase family protein [Klebsiella pneumoniae]
VQRDASGVPTITAESSHDLFFAQGFVHAQDRFWEMDFRRHLTSARLSELFVESQVGTDTFLRTLGWRDVAEQEVEMLP